MYASSSLRGYGATIPDDDDQRDLSDNEYVFGDDDDDDNLDTTEDVSPAGIPPAPAPYYPGVTTCIVRRLLLSPLPSASLVVGVSTKTTVLEEWEELSDVREHLCPSPRGCH
ncbi:hypothetical protein NLJ89_g9447 [Agrocybe chaxingu]|uniref:Uncharacterized protein n=1 Tax=Agrocybe chaxingu TaxID=84603 RepID=A0A9W8MR78_9AGAR|nr:hypothetical protein NLJ89_g9447 [Agrocybe chaxingu]